MDLRFLFRRAGNTVTSVAAAAGVRPSTASRWKRGSQADWPAVCRLYASGLITDTDLRAAGLAIPLAAPSSNEPPAAA